VRFIEESGLAANPQTTYANFVELARGRASEQPDKTAYVFLQDGENESGRFTFAELDYRARTIAAHLQLMGMTGERALLLYPPGLDYIAGFFGCLYAGVVAIPCSPPTRRQKSRLWAVINDATPAIIMSTSDFAAKIRNELEEWPECLSSNKEPNLLGDDESKPGLKWFASDKLESDITGNWLPQALGSNSLAFLQYTSGSTGNPKGVMVSHGNLMANQKAIKQGFGHTDQTTVVGWLPLYHDMGLIGNLLQPLYLGATAILMPPMAFLEKPIRWLKAISFYRASTSGGPNFAYDLCLRKVTAEQMQSLDLSSWRLAFNGSEPVRSATMEHFAEKFADCGFRRANFFPCYGLAEATLFVSGEKLSATENAMCADAGQPASAVACGLVSEHHEVRIVDPATGQLCPTGHVGEVWVSGPSIAKGYWNRQEESEQIFRMPISDASVNTAQTFLRTGDLGYLNNSRLFITGRIKDLIIIRGRNFYPQDIEQVLVEEIPELIPDACATFSKSDGDEEQLVVVAEITRTAIRSDSYLTIAAAMRKSLAETCGLAITELALVQPGTVPKTSSGKLRRQPCKQMYMENALPILFRSGAQADVDSSSAGESGGQVSEAEARATLSPESQILQQALAVVPKAQRVALIARFLCQKTALLLKIEASTLANDLPLRSLGLDSLKAVELKYTTDELLGTDVPLSLFLSDYSLQTIAEKLSETTTDTTAGIASIQNVATHGTLYTSGLSASQFSMWAMQQLGGASGVMTKPDSIVYNVHLALRINGSIDLERLKQAFRHLLERHTLLRTVYRADDNGHISQQVLPLSGLADFFTSVEACSWSQTQLQADMTHRVRVAFDLENEALLRAICYLHGRSNPDHTDPVSTGETYTLLICAHHIAVDLWSVLILVKELQAIYAGNERQLTPLKSSYAEFVAWQRHYLDGSACGKAWDYWHQQLQGELPLLALPTDKPRPAVSDYQGASVAFTLDSEISEQLKRLAGQQGVTLFALLLTAYKVLLHRHTHQEDIIVGVPSSGRSQARFTQIVGNFVNPLPLRSSPNGNKPFLTYLTEVNEALLNALAHQDLPFPLMVERLQPERVADHWPIYQTMFVLQQVQADFDKHLAQLSLGEDGDFSDWGVMQARPLALQQRVENFDFKLMAAQYHNGLQFSLQYRSDLFEAATIAAWAQHFQQLLTGIVNECTAKLKDLPLLTENERHSLTVAWNATATVYSGADSIHRLFEAQADKTPEQIALVYQDRQLSYLELDALSNRLANALIAAKLAINIPIGICAQRSLAMVVGLLGILKAGHAYLPLDPDYPHERLSAMLADADMPVILAQPEFAGIFADFNGKLYSLDVGLTDFGGFSEQRPTSPVDSEALAYVLFTSGSTGRPKGVGVPHKGVRNRLLWMQAYFGLDVGDAVLQKTPYTFDVSVWEFFWPLITGARLVMAPSGDHKDPARLVDLIERHGITTLHFVPSMLAAFLNMADFDRCGSLRRVICSGEALTADLQNRFYGHAKAGLFNLYGPTEASIDVTVWDCQRDTSDHLVPIGHAIANTQIYLLDKYLNPVPVGVAGELYIGGVQLARGYVNQAGLTAERFVPNPFSTVGGRLYRTGDLACYRQDGNIDYLGRIDHQVKMRGFRIELGEIEAVLLQNTMVRDAVVVVREEGPSDKYLAAYWVAKQTSVSDKEALQRFLQERLPDYMVPTILIEMDNLPVTDNGKLDRKALPVPNLSAQFAGHYLAPSNETETVLAQIWADLLKVERVGIHDNFFALGGDSILAIQAAGRARQAGLAFMPRHLFELQTIAKLAETISQDQTHSLAQDNSYGNAPLTPIQHWFFEQNFANPNYWNQALLLAVKVPLAVPLLEKAFDYLVSQHDALRFRFSQENKVWHQESLPHLAHSVFRRVDMAGIPDADKANVMLAECGRSQASLDLKAGVLLRAVWFDYGDHQHSRLFIVIHHLVVDGVSWRILLADLQSIYVQLAESKTVVLSAKTTSFKHWAEQLRLFAQGGELQNEADYWLTITAADTPVLPLDYPDGSRLEGVVANCIESLDETGTQALLGDALLTYRTNVDELLQVALAQTLCEWCEGESVVFDREGHGREDLFDNLDLSLTAGWFTSLYPVRLQLPKDASISQTIKSIKTQLAHIPRKGIGYGVLRYADLPAISAKLASAPKAQVLFNYLGRFDEAFTNAPWQLAPETPDAFRGSNNTSVYELEINAYVSQGRLYTQWRYSTERYRTATVAGLAKRFIGHLQKLLDHCLSAEVAGFMPSDFPLADLDQDALDALPYTASEIEDIYRLSPMQEGMLFDTLMAPNSGIYLMQDRFEMHGVIDENLFQRAWQMIIDRHSALRNGFLWETTPHPVQIVHRHVNVPFEFHDWRLLPPDEQHSRLEDILAAERWQSFDFLKPPLMAIRLIQLAKERYCFVRSYHHILIDAWCMSLMLVELMANYKALSSGQPQPQLQPPQFRNYIAWLQKRDTEAAKQFWQHYLSGITEATPFNVDRLLPSTDTDTLGVADAIMLLSAKNTKQLAAMAQRHRVTPNTFVQAAWAVLLSHYSGCTEVVFGVTVSGRPAELAGSEEMLGVFINTLPLRVAIDTTLSVSEFLSLLLQQNIELRQYEYTQLVQIQNWTGMGREQPLFESLLVFENYPVDPSLRTNANPLHIVDVATRTHTNYPLNGMVIPGEQLHLQITYHKNRFETAVVERMLGHFKNLLEAMIANPGQRLGEISLLAQTERQLMLQHWNQTAHAYPEPCDMVSRFEWQAERKPDAIAVACSGKQLTYTELNQRANRVAYALMSEGAEPETLVALFGERGIDYLVMMLGAFKAGMAYLPLDPSHPDSRIAQVLEESGALWILTCTAYFERASALADMAGGTPAMQKPASLNLQLLSRPDVLVLEELELYETSLENPPKLHHPDNLAFVIFTSGSTGTPKGAMVEYKGMFNNLITKVPTLNLTERDVIAQTAGQCFDISVWQHLTALVCGARVEIFPDDIVKEPYHLLAKLAERGVTVLEAVPSMLQALLDSADYAVALPKLRWLIACGEAFPPEVCRRWMEWMPHVKVLNAYGPAECSDDVSYYQVPGMPGETETIVPIGRPVHNTQLYLLNQWLDPVPVGVPGEICVAGIQVGRGYLERADLTAEKFIPNPFIFAQDGLGDEVGGRLYRTGDLGRYREDGAIEFLGRIDHQVKIRGVRIEPGEIEAQLLSFADIEQALVTIREDGVGGKRLVAYVVCNKSLANSDTELFAKLRGHLAARLPDAMMPQAFVRLDAMPLGGTGKIDRKALPMPDMAGQSNRAFVAPRNPTEQALATIWKEVLGIDKVGVADNFFDLGGHSLLAVQVLSRLRRAFGIDVPLRRLFEASTIEALALLVETLLIEQLDSLSEEEAEALLVSYGDG